MMLRPIDKSSNMGIHSLSAKGSHSMTSNIAKIVFLGCAILLVSSCQKPMGPWGGAAYDYTIRLEREACDAGCPGYWVEIQGTGDVTFVGKKNVKFVGAKAYTIESAQFTDLLNYITEEGVVQAKNYYSDEGEPISRTKLSIEARNRRKEIVTYVHDPANLPPKIAMVMARIDAIAKTDELVKKERVTAP
jgi:hypothetical protein